jgi:hypothetical protein
MSTLLDNAAGLSVTEGLLDIVINGNSGLYSPINGHAVDGVEYPYKIQFSDGTTAGFETGKGVWTLATNTIARTTIFTSSNGGAKVDFGPGEKFIAIVSDKQTLEDMEKMVDGATKVAMTLTERTKVGHLIVNATADLDAMQLAIAANTLAIGAAATPFPYKTAGEANRILFYGDSNALGIGGADPTMQAANTGCYFYATLGAAPWNTGNLTFRNVDPNAAAVTDTATGTHPYVGLFRASNGSSGFGVADVIQKGTGVDTYCVPFAYSGCTSEYYTTGGGAGKEGMTAMQGLIPTALAAIPGAQTFFDVVVIQLGTNDANQSIMGPEFLVNIQNTYDYMVTQGWIDIEHTQVFLSEPPAVFPAYVAGWDGTQYADNETNDKFRTIPTNGLPVAVDNTHFTAFSLNQIGVRPGLQAMIGPTPQHMLRNRNYVKRRNPEIAGDVTSGVDANINILGEKKDVADEVPKSNTFSGQSAHDDATAGNRDGGAGNFTGGDGALNQNGAGGDSRLDGGLGFGTGAKGHGLIGKGVYGCIKGYGNGTGETTVDGTVQTIDACYSGSFDQSSGMICDAAAGTIEATRAGFYFISAEFDATGSTNDSYQVFLFESTSPLTSFATTEFFIDAAGSIKHGGLSDFIELEVGEKVVLKQQSLSGGTVLTFKHIQLTAHRVSD